MKLGRAIVVLAVLGAVGGGVWYEFIRTPSAATTQTAQRPQGRGRRGAATGEPVPVVVATAARADVPVYLDALGTVQAFNTVSIKPMIDGPLVQVLFKEGQDVRTGDVLARIDARPYQAALDQAMAKKAQDEANLANARVDLARYQKLAATAYTSAQTSDTQTRDGGTGGSAGAAGSGADRHRAHQPVVHHHQQPAGRPHRHPPGGPGQHRAPGGHHAADRDHAVAADLRGVHPAAADAGRRARRRCRTRRRRCWRCRRVSPTTAGRCWTAAGSRCWTTRWTRAPAPSS